MGGSASAASGGSAMDAGRLTATGGGTAGGGGAIACCSSACCSESITVVTLVEVMSFTWVSAPSSPGLRMRTLIATLQNEQLTRSFQSRFQTVSPLAVDGMVDAFV